MTLCKKCNERMEGDGYSIVLHCPFTEEDIFDKTPDDNPIYCEFSDPDPEGSNV